MIWISIPQNPGKCKGRRRIRGKREKFMKKQIWKVLLGLGICPMVLPFVLGLYHIWIESWTMADWLVLYSFLYWWTYLAGLVLIVLAVVLKRRTGQAENGTGDK